MAVQYRTFTDRDLFVQAGAGRTIDFKVPNNIVLDDPLKSPIVSLFVRRANVFPHPSFLKKPGRWTVTMAVELNDHRISAYTFHMRESATERLVWELDRRRLRAGQDNSLHFEIDAGYGNVQISDVVIWYQTS